MKESSSSWIRTRCEYATILARFLSAMSSSNLTSKSLISCLNVFLSLVSSLLFPGCCRLELIIMNAMITKHWAAIWFILVNSSNSICVVESVSEIESSDYTRIANLQDERVILARIFMFITISNLTKSKQGACIILLSLVKVRLARSKILDRKREHNVFDFLLYKDI